MDKAVAAVEVPLGLSQAQGAWNAFESIHQFLLSGDTPESFEETCVRVASRLGKTHRTWKAEEELSPEGRLSLWRGDCEDSGTSVVYLGPLANGATKLTVVLPGELPDGRVVSEASLRLVVARLATDLHTFGLLARMEQAKAGGRKTALIK